MLQNRPSQARALDNPAPKSASRSALNGRILLFCVIAFMTAAFFLLNVVESPVDLTARFTVDDSFYYYETAWQTRLNGFVTFDSINRANGVHFLWFMILLAVAWLAPGKLFILYAAYCISLILVMAVYVAIWRAGTLAQDRSRLLTLFMALCWTFLLSDRSNLFFVGMESTLHMATLWGCLCACLVLLRALDEAGRFPGREFLVFTLFLVLMTWARLDSALFAIFLYVYAVAAIVRRPNLDKAAIAKYLALSVTIAMAGAAVQIGFFYGAGGTVLPISGLVKATGVGPEIKAGLWARYMSIVFPIPTFVGMPTPWQLAAELALFAALLGYAVTRSRTAAAPMRHLHGFAAALGIATVVYAPIVGANHDPFWRWYLSPVYLFYIVTVASALREAREALRWRAFRIPALAATAGIAVSLLFMLLFFASYMPVPHFLARAQLGQVLKQTTAKEDILAAFNAGQVAFFSERRTINLDGLVNDYAFLRDVLNKPENLAAYLREKNVRYVVDYDFYWANAAIVDGTAARSSFPIIGDRLLRILYVREVQSR